MNLLIASGNFMIAGIVNLLTITVFCYLASMALKSKSGHNSIYDGFLRLHGGGTIATAAKILDLMEEVQSLQVKMDEECSQAISGDVRAVPMLRNSAHLSSLFPFALLQRQSIKPALPTSTWKDLEDEDNLVKRDDEFVDLSSDMS